MTVLKKLVILVALTAMMMPLAAAAPATKIPANAPPPSMEGNDEVWGDKPSSELPSYLQFNPQVDITTALSLRHRTKDEILMWSEQTVAALMSFGASNLYDHFEEIKPLFVESGWNDFMKYINSAGLQDYVREKRYQLITVINGPTYVRREGPLGGIYRWEIEAPLLFSFYKTDAYGNIPAETDPDATAELQLVISVTRVPEGGGEEQVAIAGWRVQDGRKNRRQRMP